MTTTPAAPSRCWTCIWYLSFEDGTRMGRNRSQFVLDMCRENVPLDLAPMHLRTPPSREPVPAEELQAPSRGRIDIKALLKRVKGARNAAALHEDRAQPPKTWNELEAAATENNCDLTTATGKLTMPVVRFGPCKTTNFGHFGSTIEEIPPELPQLEPGSGFVYDDVLLTFVGRDPKADGAYLCVPQCALSPRQ